MANSSHDQNFKNLILDYPRQALEFFAPKEAADLPANVKITPIRQELLKARLGDRFQELDVPLLVQWPDGQREAIVFVIEEETRPSPWFLYRLAVYCLGVAELMKTTRIVAVAIHPFAGGVRRERLTLATERSKCLDFEAIVCRLADIDASVYRSSGNMVVRTCLPMMSPKMTTRADVISSALDGVRELEKDPERQLKYTEFVLFYARLTKSELKQVQQEQHRRNAPMTTLDMLKEQGSKEGEVKGTVKTLMQLHKDGLLDSDVVRRKLNRLAKKKTSSTVQDLIEKALKKLK